MISIRWKGVNEELWAMESVQRILSLAGFEPRQLPQQASVLRTELPGLMISNPLVFILYKRPLSNWHISFEQGGRMNITLITGIQETITAQDPVNMVMACF